jgi:hypothetical protein
MPTTTESRLAAALKAAFDTWMNTPTKRSTPLHVHMARTLLTTPGVEVHIPEPTSPAQPIAQLSLPLALPGARN